VSATEPNLVDRYVSRYVETPSTEYIRMPKNCTLLREEDFEKIAGSVAVRETAKGQHGAGEDGRDPYEKYLKTCDNGDVKPLLPLFQFDFVQDQTTWEESIEVQLNYKLLTMPRKKDYMYDIYPIVQKRFNNAGLGFHISGPYCYGNDPKRGYSFDMDFDSRDPKKMIKLEHACIEGLPCLPPAAELYTDASSIDVKPIPDDTTTVSIGPWLFFSVAVTFFCAIIIYMYRSNRSLRRRLEAAEMSEGYMDADRVITNVDEEERVSIPYEALEEVAPSGDSGDLSYDSEHEHEHDEDGDEETTDLIEHSVGGASV